jgi:hypothetical protein
MMRKIIVTVCLLGALNVAASACDWSDCTATAKPMNIRQFMHQQAASTRALNPLPKAASRAVRNTYSPKGAAVTPRRANSVRAALRQPLPAVHKRPIQLVNKAIFHSRSLLARRKSNEVPPVASAFAAQEQLVEVVTSDETNAIDRAAGLSEALNSKDQTALQLVSQAFDEIDRKNEGSLTVDDLQAASQRAQVKEPPHSTWLQQMWMMITGTASGTNY